MPCQVCTGLATGAGPVIGGCKVYGPKGPVLAVLMTSILRACLWSSFPVLEHAGQPVQTLK